jgi:glycosyltransferase involved in cell wall biosynthesis
MQMPAPSEVFLSVEIRGLMAYGAEIQVYSLRAPHTNHIELVAAQHLEGVEIKFFPTFSLNAVSAMMYCSRLYPTILFDLLFKILLTCWFRPILLFKSLSLIPKSFVITREVMHGNFDAVHFAWGHYPSIIAYLVKKLIPKLPVTMSLGAYDLHTKHPMTAKAANIVNCILTQSMANAEQINTWPSPKTRVEVIYRGVEFDSAQLYSPPNHVPGLIVTAGRLIPDKGHQYLISALPRILDAVPYAELVIFGEGNYRTQLEELITQLGLENKVRLAGHQPHEKLFKEVAQASVFALASDHERLPNSVKEAMVLGVPIVTTPTVGIDELVQDGKTGLIVAFGDSQQIADKIISILTNPSLAKQLGDAGHTHIRNFDIRLTSKQRYDLYQALVHPNSTLDVK